MTEQEEWGQGRDTEKEVYKPTAEQLVQIPGHVKWEKRTAWFERDLIAAIGAEYIDPDGSEQPFIKKARTKKPTPKPNGNRRKQSPQSFPF